MRKRGRPTNPIVEDDLRRWLEDEVDGIYERMQSVAPRDQRAWVVREVSGAVERYHDRREKWRTAVKAQDVLEGVIDVLERVSNGELPHKMQAAWIDRAFSECGVMLSVDLFVEHAAATERVIVDAGGPAKWAMHLVSRATGVTTYSLYQHRVHRQRAKALVIDTLRTPVSSASMVPDEEWVH